MEWPARIAHWCLSAMGKALYSQVALPIAVFVLLSLAVVVYLDRRYLARGLRATLRQAFPRKNYRHATTKVDVWSWILSIVLWSPITGAIFATLSTVNTYGLLSHFFGIPLATSLAPWAYLTIQALTLFFAREFTVYWFHRWMHTVPVLWSFHRPHHSAEAMTFFTNARSHPVETIFFGSSTVIAGFAMGVISYVIGAPMITSAAATLALIVGVWETSFAYLIHSHLRLSFGPLDFVLNTPVMHQIHHSVEVRHRDKNLGRLTVIFDWMFGTLYVPRAQADKQYRWGLNDQERGTNNPHLSLLQYYIEPFRHAWRTWIGNRRSAGEAG